MFGTIRFIIKAIPWVVFLWNGFYLFGCSIIAKFLVNSNIIWLRVLTNPSGTAKSVNKAAGTAVRHALWAIGALAVLIIMYT